MSLDLSVVIITKNEQANLARCLKALPSHCEIVVVDSLSTDGTAHLAESYGATVYQKEFVDFSTQKNFAIQKSTRRWVLSLDADEVLSSESKSWLESQEFLDVDDCVVFTITRRLHFLGRRLRFGRSRDVIPRFFKKGHSQFVGKIHESLQPINLNQQPIFKRMPGFLDHYSYHSLQDYFEVFNRYTSSMAEDHAQKKNSRAPAKITPALKLLWTFLDRYILRFGFMDGYEGFVYACNSSFYRFVKYTKIIEQCALDKSVKPSGDFR